ncbi:MAG: hypothetical protein RIS79_1058 [Verrucomicrobiota bacterium]|jgi:hypothetical protein
MTSTTFGGSDGAAKASEVDRARSKQGSFMPVYTAEGRDVGSGFLLARGG